MLAALALATIKPKENMFGHSLHTMLGCLNFIALQTDSRNVRAAQIDGRKLSNKSEDARCLVS